MKRWVRRSAGEYLRSLQIGAGLVWREQCGAAFRELQRGERTKIVRIPRDREAEHLAVCGNTGSGKTSLLMGITDHAEQRGETCVVFDPHQQFIKRYYDPRRGDRILNPCDGRCVAWNPCDEVDYTNVNTAETTALALAASLLPGRVGQRDWFFIDAGRRILQRIWAHYRANAQQTVELLTHIDPLIDEIARGNDLETMLRENAAQQRAGIQATVTQCLPALRLMPTESEQNPRWSARAWESGRQGWLFVTATTDTRVALRPVQSMWLDYIIMRLVDGGDRPGCPTVRMVIDEVQTLQELPNLAMCLQETRKSGVMCAIGFHGMPDMKDIYRDQAESIVSAPSTKIILRTGEPGAQEWAAKVVGNHDVERLREHVDSKGNRSYTTERANAEPLIMPTEFRGFEPRVGVLVHGDYSVKLKFCYAKPRDPVAEGFVLAKGAPPQLLPMPSLQEVLARKKREAEERAAALAALTAARNQAVSQPPAAQRGRRKAAVPSDGSGGLFAVQIAAPQVAANNQGLEGGEG